MHVLSSKEIALEHAEKQLFRIGQDNFNEIIIVTYFPPPFTQHFHVSVQPSDLIVACLHDTCSLFIRAYDHYLIIGAMIIAQ